MALSCSQYHVEPTRDADRCDHNAVVVKLPRAWLKDDCLKNIHASINSVTFACKRCPAHFVSLQDLGFRVDMKHDLFRVIMQSGCVQETSECGERQLTVRSNGHALLQLWLTMTPFLCNS